MKGRPGPALPDSPKWLVDFLGTQSEEMEWGLPEAFFGERFSKSGAVVLLDGLDEAASRDEREVMVRLIEKAAEAYSKCRFVVTTRPQGKAAIAGFDEVTIDPLEPDAIAGFLDHWCRVLTFESEDRRAKHHGELLEALRSRPEIRRMAKNPVMLTALAVVHWNETRIPEQRADLYESVLKWLARSRKERPERPSPDRCLELLQVLALAMQDQPAGRVVQVDRGWGADVLTSELGSKPPP